MEIAFLLVALTTVVLVVTATADRFGLPAPLLLIAVGIIGSFLPWLPDLHLEPEVVLLGLLPPLLYTAALQTSLVDFRANRRPILLLSVGLVVFTAFGVAVVVHTLIPGVSWPVAVAIGAVVAPPDAVAATAVARRIGLPRRIVTILEGESLLNDATALVTLRTAIAAMAAAVEAWRVGLDFLLAAGGGAVVGLVAFAIVAWVRRRVTNPLIDCSISLVTPFAAYLTAEEITASGVIAVVVAGLLLGHKAPIIQTAQSRIADRMNWRSISFLLENAVFLLIGLQAHWIIADVANSSLGWGRVILVCLSTLAAVIVLRIVWVLAARSLLVRQRPGRPDPTPWSHSLVLGWAGMRGVVTLAAAFIIPIGTPHREILLLIAFTVVAGTLFIQGLTLPWLTRVLGVPAPDPAEDMLARATLLQQATEAGFEVLDRDCGEEDRDIVDGVKQRIEQRNFAVWEMLGQRGETETPSQAYVRLRSKMIDAERRKVLEVRGSGSVPSEIVREVLGMLDVEESMLVAADDTADEVPTTAPLPAGSSCDDLAHTPAVPARSTPAECADCIREGLTPVHLRRCLECGNVGCCDSSVGRHATRHFHDTGHRVMQSAEPGETWRWCYLHNLTG